MLNISTERERERERERGDLIMIRSK